MKKPVLEILSTATGKPTDGFVTTPTANDEFEATVQFLEDGPDGEVVFQWIDTPNGCVQWTDRTYNWKHKFKIKADGEFFVRAFDENGFHFDSEPVFVKIAEG